MVPSDNNCWGAVQYATVNGVQRSVSYATAVSGGHFYTSMKVSSLGFANPSEAQGAQVRAAVGQGDRERGIGQRAV